MIASLVAIRLGQGTVEWWWRETGEGGVLTERMATFRHEDVSPPPGWPPLFERLIYYMLVPELFSKFFVELGLGFSGRALTQPKFYVFYLLVLIEYVFGAFSLGQKSFRKNLSNTAFLLLLTMTIHGFIIARYWHNPIAKTLTDTIPVLVAAANVLLLNTSGAFKNFNFPRLQKRVWIFSVLMISGGILGVLLHRGSTEITFGGSGSEPICMSVILVSLATKPFVSVVDLTLMTFIIGPTVPFINRTTLAVFLLAFVFLVAPRLFRNLKQVYFSVFLVVAAVAAFVAFVPPDSKLVTRVTGLADQVNSNTSQSETGGSLGERRAEWDAVNAKLATLGPVAQYFGYGPGGVYIVQFTGGLIPENYSHAHFSWALFELRYGYCGYFYLGFCTLLVLLNLARHAIRRDALSRLVVIIDLWCIVYLFTYAFFNFLVAGLQFSDTGEISDEQSALLRRDRRDEAVATT